MLKEKRFFIITPDSLVRMGVCQVFKDVDYISKFVMGEQNQYQSSSFDRGEKWVEQYVKDFGTTPSFF